MKDSGNRREGRFFLVKLLLIGIIGLFCLGSGVNAEGINASFAPVPQSGPAPLTVSFVDQSEGNPTHWAWDLDGVPGWDNFEQNPTYTYTTPGTYYVNLTVWNGTDASDSGNYAAVINVTPPILSPEFAASPRVGYAPLNVSFIDLSSGAACWNWTFDENSTSPGSEKFLPYPVHMYADPGWYTVILNISDNCTSPDSRSAELRQEDFIHVLQIPKPQADFTASPRSGTTNLTVIFTDQTPATEPLSYIWDFGDGSVVSYDRNPVHTYTSKGLFDVVVAVTGAGGTTLVNKTSYIAVDTPPAPLADFAVSPANGTAPLSVSFIGLAEGTGHLTYEWDFGDNSTHVYGRNPVHLYNTADSYNVTLNVTDGTKNGSVTRNNCVIVREPAPLSAMFTATPRNGTAPLEVSFIDQSFSDEPLTYEWDFGDGSVIAHDRNPVHTYTTEGLYNVTLEVKGSRDPVLIRQNAFINVEKPALHKVDFTAAPLSGPVPLSVSFIDQSVGEGPFTYLWNFGDGSNQSFDRNPGHTYVTPGLYTVNLTVNSSTSSIRVIKEEMINATTALDARPVYANFTAAALRGVAPFNAQFMDLSTGPVAAWRWSFGDGSMITEQGPNHTYVNPGVYDVTLDVFNKSGSSNTMKYPGFITALSPTVTSRVAIIYADLTNHKKIQFFDKSDGVGINSWQWNFGDGSAVSTEQNPVHEFITDGTYSVSLTVSNGYATSSNIFMVGIK